MSGHSLPVPDRGLVKFKFQPDMYVWYMESPSGNFIALDLVATDKPGYVWSSTAMVARSDYFTLRQNKITHKPISFIECGLNQT